MNSKEKEMCQIAFMNLDKLLQKDKNAIVTAEELMSWFRKFYRLEEI